MILIKNIYISTAGDVGSLTRKGSLDRKDKRSSWTSSSTLGGGPPALSEVGGQAPADIGCLLDSFPPVTLTVSSFFKQVWQRLSLDYKCDTQIFDHL